MNRDYTGRKELRKIADWIFFPMTRNEVTDFIFTSYKGDDFQTNPLRNVNNKQDKNRYKIV